MLDQNKLRAKLAKVDAIANDKRAQAGDRANAKTMGEKIREQMKNNHSSADARYKELVKKGIQVVADEENANWLLGEYAYEVTEKMARGEKGCKQYAEDIGKDYTTLLHCRKTFEVWCIKDGKVCGRPQISFWTAYPLNSLPANKRSQILAKTPKLTQRKAKEEARDHKKTTPRPTQKTNKRAARASKKKNVDHGRMEREICAILSDFMSPNGDVDKLLNDFDYGSATGGVQAKKRIMTCLTNLRSRVEAKIAWLENINRLG